MIASPATELSRSASPRPATTAPVAMGMARKRSVTPRAASAATAVMVVSSPNSMAMTNIPGTRNSR